MAPHDYISAKLPLYYVAGVIYTTVAILTHITDRKRAEERLRESEHIFRSVFENAQIVVRLLSVVGSVTDPSTSELGDENRP